MNKIQKKARFNLVVIALIFALSSVAVFFMRKMNMLEIFGWLGFWWIIALPSLVGPPPFVPSRKKHGPVIFDERDAIIEKRASLAAFRAFWYAFPITCMILYWYISQGTGSISVSVLTIMAGEGGILVTLVQSVSILIQYSQGSKDN